MQNKSPFKVNLEIEDLDISQSFIDDHMAVIEVYVCHDGNNAHNLPIPLASIKAAQESLKNKPLVAGFDGRDFEGHEIDEVLIGYFPESSKMKYVEKNGKTYLVAEAIMPKLYATWAYEIFLKENNKGVSMEIEVYDFEEDEKSELKTIKKFIFNAVTVLGNSHIPACEGSSASIIKFSRENASKIYNKHLSSSSIKDKFIKNMKKQKFSGKEEPQMDEAKIPVQPDETTYMSENIIIDNNKDSAIDSKSWSNPGKELYEPILQASNKDALIKEAYLIYEDGYEDAPSEKLKYPHHEVKGTNLVLNVKGVEAAFQRASQEGIVSGDVKKHLLRHYKELELSTENFEINERGEESMPEEKMEDKVTKEEIEKDDEKEALKEQKEDEKSDRDDAKEEAQEEKMEENSEIDKDDEEEDKKEEEKEPEKIEAEEEKEESHPEEEMEALKKENCELKEKLFAYEEAEKMRAVESVLASVVDVVEKEDLDNLRIESKEYNLSNIGTFENKVKAFAFDKKASSAKPTAYTKMAITEIGEVKPNGLW